MNKSFTKDGNPYLFLGAEKEYSQIRRELNKLAPLLETSHSTSEQFFLQKPFKHNHNNHKVLFYTNQNENENKSTSTSKIENINENKNMEKNKGTNKSQYEYKYSLLKRYSYNDYDDNSLTFESKCDFDFIKSEDNYRLFPLSIKNKSKNQNRLQFLIKNYRTKKIYKQNLFTSKQRKNSKNFSSNKINTEDILNFEENLLQSKIKNNSIMVKKIKQFLDSERKKNLFYYENEKKNNNIIKIINHSEIRKNTYKIIKPFEDAIYLNNLPSYNSKTYLSFKLSKPNFIDTKLFDKIDSYIKSNSVKSTNLTKSVDKTMKINKFNKFLKFPNSTKRFQFTFSSPKQSLNRNSFNGIKI